MIFDIVVNIQDVTILREIEPYDAWELHKLMEAAFPSTECTIECWAGYENAILIPNINS